MKLVLGTASWGQPYGIKNQRTSPQEIERILDTAYNAGVRMIDTAPAYNCKNSFVGFKVIQKTPYAGNAHAVLQHNPDGVPTQDGISIYTVQQLLRALEHSIKIVQLPLNIVDGRFLQYLPMLRERGIEIHARSVFLQGALLIGAFGLPKLDIETCLGYVLAQDVDYVVVGVNSEQELKQLLKVKPNNADNYHILDEQLIDPRNWRRG